MKISVPKDLGGDVKLLPEGTVRATFSRFTIGKSKAGEPKGTVKWIITDADEPGLVGETVLETFSLQEQALWNLNTLYKDCTGEDLEHKEYSEEEFAELVNDACKGVEFDLELENETYDGKERTKVNSRSKVETKKKKKK